MKSVNSNLVQEEPRMNLGHLQLLDNRAEEIKLFETSIKEKARSVGKLEILEAGCGRRWPINLADIEYTLTGIDLDRTALEKRKTIQKDLDEIILGDLRKVDLPEGRYDVIYNSFVLEHIMGAEKVLWNFVQWLKPNGLMILRFPDRDSVYGFFARISPFWFHVGYKKYIYGDKNAGKPGYGPYPTFYDSVISRTGMRAFCELAGLTIKSEYGIERLSGIQQLCSQLVEVASFGHLDSKHINLGYILEKK